MDEGEVEIIQKKVIVEGGAERVIEKMDKRVQELDEHIKKDREIVHKPWKLGERKNWSFETLLKKGELDKCGFTGDEHDVSQKLIAKAVAQFFYGGNPRVFEKWYERKRANGKFLEKITAGKNEYMLYEEAKKIFEDDLT